MKDTEPILTTATALQNLIEAVQGVEHLLDDTRRANVEKALARARQARVALNQWVEEQRG